MKRVSMMLASAAAVLLFVAQPVVANTEVESELAEMRALVKGLKDKVDAQDEQLAHQGALLENAQQVVQQTQQESKSLSGLAKFIDSLEVDGGVAGSYFWNFNRPDLNVLGYLGVSGIGGNQGGSYSGQFYPYHPDHNSFQLDALWFGIGKPASEEGRAGFRADMVYGQTASSLNDFGAINSLLGAIGYGSVPAPISGLSRILQGDSSSDFYLHQAYAEYLAPLGDGVNFKAGKFKSLSGTESLDSMKNNHITHSVQYATFNPIDHLGILLSAMAGPVELTVGVANSTGRDISSPDWNKSKSIIVGAAYEQDKLSVRGTVNYGAEGFASPVVSISGNNGEKTGLFNLAADFAATDQLALWFNANYQWVQGSASGAFGIGSGGRMAINDRLGVALRGEYVKDRQDYFMIGDPFSALCASGNPCNDFNPGKFNPNTGLFEGLDSEIYSLTGTADYALVENLVIRGEIRWDQVRQRGTNEFYKGNGTRDVRGQTTIGAQLYYSF